MCVCVRVCACVCVCVCVRARARARACVGVSVHFADTVYRSVFVSVLFFVRVVVYYICVVSVVACD